MKTTAINWPHPLIEKAWDSRVYETGISEPWVQQLVAAFMIAGDKRKVLELGGYLGYTSAWLALTLERMGEGELSIVEHDAKRFEKIHAVFEQLDVPNVKYQVWLADSISVIRELDDASVELVWLDDDHTAKHVSVELDLLIPKMAPQGLILMHDVYGTLGLDLVCQEHGGYVIKLPRLGPAGGIGVIQC